LFEKRGKSGEEQVRKEEGFPKVDNESFI